MARTPEGQALTEAHRVAQATISAAVMRQMLLLWRLIDPKNVKGSFPALLELALPFLVAAHGQSASLANVYLGVFQEAEGSPDVRSDAEPALSPEQVYTSLLVTGPVAFLTGVRAGQDEQEAMTNAVSQLMGAGSRLALQGGRETIMQTGAVGWARVTSGGACYFCAMLASRGAVYSKETAGFDAHDHCHCQPEPVYRDGNGDYQNPGQADELRDLYNSSTAGLSSADSLPAFRRAYEAQGK